MDNEQPLEVWFEPADNRRFVVLLTRVVLAVGTVALIGGIVLSLAVSSWVDTAEWDEDRVVVDTLAAAMAQGAGAPAAGRLDGDDGRYLFVVDLGPEGSRPLRDATIRAVPEGFETRAGAEPRWADWFDTIAGQAANRGLDRAPRFDPSDTAWMISEARIDDDTVLVVMRPRSDALRLSGWVNRLLLGIGAAVALTLLGVWLTLRAKVLRSTERLIEAAEDLRVRGEFRPPTKSGLSRIPERPLEFKRLARSLDHIERDARRSLEQIESLLLAAQTLGASLDSSDVLENTLAQIETLLGVERSAILRFDARFESFSVLAARGHTPDFLEALRIRPAERDLPTVRCLAEQVPVQVSDTESVMVNPVLKQRAREFGYRSLLAVPLPGTLDTPSLLLVHKAEPYTYAHDEIELSASFASIAAAAIRNAELFARTDDTLRSQTSQLGAIIESVDQGILVESQAGVVLFANSTMERMLDPSIVADPGAAAPPVSASADFVESVLASAADPDGARAALDRVAESPDGWCDIDLHRGDRLLTFRVRGFRVTADDGRPIGRGQIWTDVTDERALDKMKSGLLATISHEFRTPLALIKGYATTLLADDVEWGQAERVEFLSLVSGEADRLTGLVERLLDMRRIDAGMVRLDPVPIDLPSLLDATLAGLPHVRARIVVDPTSPPLVVAVDEARIVTVLRNLLENACRYSPDDEPVTVMWRVDGEDRSDRGRARGDGGGDTAAVITIIDRGEGIDTVDRERIFATFVRGGGGDEFGGIGLGLAIARGFAEAHGGKLWVEPGADGVGSRFSVRLPLEPNPATLPV